MAFIFLSGCAAKKIERGDIEPDSSIAMKLPLDAKLAIFIPNTELDKKYVHYTRYGTKIEFPTGKILRKAGVDVSKKFFKKVVRFSNHKPINYLLKLESEASLGEFFGTYNTVVKASLYKSNGKLLNQTIITETEVSSFLNDKSAFYNAYVKNITSYLDSVFQENKEFRVATYRPEQPKPISFRGLMKHKSIELMATGSGFFVNEHGYLVTNQHAIEDCLAVSVNYNGTQRKAYVVAADKDSDIAVLKTSFKPVRHAVFVHPKFEPRLGENTITVGYPLHGILSSKPTLTTGNISALAGIEGNERFLQMSAPVQPGNSGGPLINSNGLIHGVVQSKLDAMTLAAFTGDIAQNINFAVKSKTALKLLLKKRIKFYTQFPSRQFEKSTPDIADEATKYTLQMMCYG